MDFFGSTGQTADMIAPNEEQPRLGPYPSAWFTAELDISSTWNDCRYYPFPHYSAEASTVLNESIVSSMPDLADWATTAISTPTLLGSDDVAITPPWINFERTSGTPIPEPKISLGTTSSWEVELDFTLPLEGYQPSNSNTFSKSPHSTTELQLQRRSNATGNDKKSSQIPLQRVHVTKKVVALGHEALAPASPPTPALTLEIPSQKRRKRGVSDISSQPIAKQKFSAPRHPINKHKTQHEILSGNVPKPNLQQEKRTPVHRIQDTSLTTNASKKSKSEKKKHSVIEKKYRISIKERFERLLDVLPAPERDLKGDGSCTIFRGQLRRSKVLDLARTHIQSLETVTNKLQEENRMLNEEVDTYKANVMRLGLPNNGEGVGAYGFEEAT